MSLPKDITFVAILDADYAERQNVKYMELVNFIAEIDESFATILRLKSLDRESQQQTLNNIQSIVNATTNIHWAVNGSEQLQLPTSITGRHWPSSFLVAENPPPTSTSCGYSVHTIREAVLAEESGADWALVSPFRTPHSKPKDFREPLRKVGVKHLQQAMPTVSTFALGGVLPEDYHPITKAGLQGLAVLGPVHQKDRREVHNVIQQYLKFTI